MAVPAKGEAEDAHSLSKRDASGNGEGENERKV